MQISFPCYIFGLVLKSVKTWASFRAVASKTLISFTLIFVPEYQPLFELTFYDLKFHRIQKLIAIVMPSHKVVDSRNFNSECINFVGKRPRYHFYLCSRLNWPESITYPKLRRKSIFVVTCLKCVWPAFDPPLLRLS